MIKSLNVFSTWIEFNFWIDFFRDKKPFPSADEPPCDLELIAPAGPAGKIEYVDLMGHILHKCVSSFQDSLCKRTWTDCMAGGCPGKSGSQSEEFEKSQRSRWGCHRIWMLYLWKEKVQDHGLKIKKKSWGTCSAGCKLPHTLVAFTTQLTELQRMEKIIME